MAPSFFTSISCLLLAGTALAAPLSVGSKAPKIVFEFPNDKYQNFENIALTDDGQLLLTSTAAPHIYTLDPTTTSPEISVITTFPNATGTFGIAEVSTNIFALAVGSGSLKTFAGIPGTYSIHMLDMTNADQPVITLLTPIPEASSMNGMTAISGSPGLILVADSGLGAVWCVDTASGTYTTSIQDPLMAPTKTFSLGINGIHELDGTVYFTSSALGVFGKFDIDSKGIATGPAVELAKELTNGLNIYDDFVLDSSGNAYIAVHPFGVSLVTISGVQVRLDNSTMFAQPVAAAWDKGAPSGCTLYVVTAGNPQNKPIVCGQVISVDVCESLHV